jgi:hypothetical protein
VVPAEESTTGAWIYEHKAAAASGDSKYAGFVSIYEDLLTKQGFVLDATTSSYYKDNVGVSLVRTEKAVDQNVEHTYTVKVRELGD